jgi:hypothetical protein
LIIRFHCGVQGAQGCGNFSEGLPCGLPIFAQVIHGHTRAAIGRLELDEGERKPETAKGFPFRGAFLFGVKREPAEDGDCRIGLPQAPKSLQNIVRLCRRYNLGASQPPQNKQAIFGVEEEFFRHTAGGNPIKERTVELDFPLQTQQIFGFFVFGISFKIPLDLLLEQRIEQKIRYHGLIRPNYSSLKKQEHFHRNDVVQEGPDVNERSNPRRGHMS